MLTIGHEFFSAANANSILSLKQIKITSLNNCFEQLNLAWPFGSVSSPAYVSLNTSNQDGGKKMIRMTPDCAI